MIIEKCNHTADQNLCDDCHIKNDAARFRWLLDNCNDSFDATDEGPQFICPMKPYTPPHWREIVRSRIDDISAPSGRLNLLVSDLPTVEDAGIVAVGLSEELTAQEQAFFVAGFQECIKYLISR